ncbi:MAG: ParB/RepB/Spo0J family partition protein [Pelagibacteraceae bacterium]|nr:ParB/RepB/Spo0J family partition protein [Pelagibacteraceae bacterium]MBT5214956.1 ParB/RepB/Spo0J family partition protein [Pelagibacteraceae bacterium]
MNKDKKKLGMGLGALLSANTKNTNNINKIDISKISPNKQQPRKNFEDQEIKELSNSIKNQGLIQPIVVREIENNEYEIIAGERRWRACQLAGLHSVECVVMSVSEESVYELALVENIQRQNLNVVEEAKAYKNLIRINNLKNEDLAKKLGKSSSHISNLIRILELDDEIHQMIIDGKISMGHARALIGVPNAVERAKEIFEKKLSVRDVEKSTSKYKQTRKKQTEKDPNIADLEKELSDKIGLKTEIQFNDNGSSGSLKLYYSDLNQLDEIMKRLKK